MNVEFKEIKVKNTRATQKPKYLVDVIFSKQKFQEDKKEFYKLYLIVSKNLRYFDKEKIFSYLNNFVYSINYKNKDKLVNLISNTKEPINYKISNTKEKQLILINLPANLFIDNKLELVFNAKFKANNLNEEFSNIILLNNKSIKTENSYLNNLVTYYKNFEENRTNLLYNLLTYQLNYKPLEFTINQKYQKIMDFDYNFKVNLHKDFNRNWEINYLINNLLNLNINNFIQINKLQINDYLKTNKFYKDLPKGQIKDDGIYFNNNSIIKDKTVINNSNEKGFIFNGLVENTFYYDLKIFNDLLNFQTKVNSIKFIDCNDCKFINPIISKYLLSKEFFQSLEINPNLESDLNKYEVK
ncbi:hypothetical protein [Mycoplasma leachii]|uniref:hypothetical protein n=1 Tax=Mycoplasma leachii TaxID=2105 RepID=UPI003DA2EC0D